MRPRENSFHTFTWRGVTSRVTLTRNYRIEGWSVIDVIVLEPRGAPLPFAVDGRLHHGVEQDTIDAAGGVLSFLTAWAERDAATPAYVIAVARWKQGDLFTF